MASARIMYGDAEIDADFEEIHEHYGRNWKVTEVLRQLVREKAREIRSGETRRDQIKALREDVDEYHFVEVSYLKAILERLKNDHA